MKGEKPPDGLQEAGQRFWVAVMAEYALTEAHDLARLFQACRSLDEISDAEAVIQETGRFITNRFGELKENPASVAIRECRTALLRALREMGLNLTTGPDARPRPRY